MSMNVRELFPLGKAYGAFSDPPKPNQLRMDHTPEVEGGARHPRKPPQLALRRCAPFGCGADFRTRTPLAMMVRASYGGRILSEVIWREICP